MLSIKNARIFSLPARPAHARRCTYDDGDRALLRHALPAHTSLPLNLCRRNQSILKQITLKRRGCNQRAIKSREPSDWSTYSNV